MLAQIYSLRGERIIDGILKKGQKKQSDNFGVFFVNRKDKDHSKFAFIISKKISRLAVNRNRVKRALSESVRRNMERIPNGVSFVFLAKKSIVGRSTEEIMIEVQNFISKFELK